MPVWRVGGSIFSIQLQPGEIGANATNNTANLNPGFRNASPELYWRAPPWMGDELFKLGLPWPMAPFSNDASMLPGAAGDWRVFQLFSPAADGGSREGVVDLTEADDTLAATGALLIKGTLAVTAADDTVTSTGTLPVKADVAIAEADDTLVATGVVANDRTGTADITEADDTVAAAAVLAIAGTLSVTEADDALAASVQMPIFYPQRGGVDERQEIERRQREWQEKLRRIIDQAWAIAHGLIDPVTLEPIPPPDYSPLIEAMLDQALSLDRQRVEAFTAGQRRLEEDDAIAMLLLA